MWLKSEVLHHVVAEGPQNVEVEDEPLLPVKVLSVDLLFVFSE